VAGAAHNLDALEITVEVCLFVFPEIVSVAMKARLKACQVAATAHLVQGYGKINRCKVLEGLVDVDEAIV
jgi:hypothetical protein